MKLTDQQRAELKALAEGAKGWSNCNQAWLDTSEDTACATVGHISEDGETYPLAVIDCEQYYSGDSLLAAKYYAAANPASVLALLADLEDANTRIAELERVQGVLVEALDGMLRDVQALMLESDGVAGFHQNGDIAPWGELEEGGRFERLSHMTDAVQAIAAAQKPEGGDRE